MSQPTRPRFASVALPDLAADYARLPAGAGPSVTAGHAVGVAFTPQRRAVWQVGSDRTRSRSFPPGAVFVVPAEGLDWAEWTDTSESVEMWLSPQLLGELSQLAGGPSTVVFDYHEAGEDPVVLNVASLVRESLFSADADGADLESAGLFLASHVLERYHGLRLPRPGPVRNLDRAVLIRVTEYMEAHLACSPGLVELSRIAGLSPHHFAKAFKATTGSAPHAYLAARRMERALVLLQQSQLPVSRIARLVGFRSLTHFRSRFRRSWGEATAIYRNSGRPRRAA